MSTNSPLAPYPGKNVEAWDRIPLGVGGQGQEVWDVSTNPHLTIVGSAGTGKTVALRTVLAHTLQHPDHWSVLGVCVGDPELAQYRRASENIIGVARSMEDANATMRFVREAAEQRYAKMAQQGVVHYTQLSDRPKAILLMIDGTPAVTMPTDNPADGKLVEAMDANIRYFFRFGRAAGVHVACTFQRPDVGDIFTGVARENSLRYATGQLSPIASYLVFGNTDTTDTTDTAERPVRGRGALASGKFKRDFQGYYTPATWFDQDNSATFSSPS